MKTVSYENVRVEIAGTKYTALSPIPRTSAGSDRFLTDIAHNLNLR